MPFVLRSVAAFVAQGQYAPDFRADPKRMWDALENRVAVLGPVAETAQRGERQRMRRVLCEIETALD